MVTKKKLKEKVKLIMRQLQIERELADRYESIEAVALAQGSKNNTVELMAERARIEDLLKTM